VTVELVCHYCGGAFVVYPSQIRKGGGKFCDRDCLHAWRATPEGRASQSARMIGKRNGLKHGRDAGRDKPGSLRRDAWHDPSKTCRWPGCDRRGVKLDQHHVCYRQHLKRASADLWDGRNALALCAVHHATHHHQITPLPLVALRDENFAYAAEVMGAAAYDYLRRRYAGDDPRLDALLADVA
jgi:hypothetical protein